MGHILLELSTVTYLSCVVLHSMAHFRQGYGPCDQFD